MWKPGLLGLNLVLLLTALWPWANQTIPHFSSHKRVIQILLLIRNSWCYIVKHTRFTTNLHTAQLSLQLWRSGRRKRIGQRNMFYSDSFPAIFKVYFPHTLCDIKQHCRKPAHSRTYRDNIENAEKAVDAVSCQHLLNNHFCSILQV